MPEGPSEALGVPRHPLAQSGPPAVGGRELAVLVAVAHVEGYSHPEVGVEMAMSAGVADGLLV